MRCGTAILICLLTSHPSPSRSEWRSFELAKNTMLPYATPDPVAKEIH